MENNNLNGTEKQVAWAATIQPKMMEEVNSFRDICAANVAKIAEMEAAGQLAGKEAAIAKAKAELARNLAMLDQIASIKSASFWIENRTTPVRVLMGYVIAGQVVLPK